MFWLLRFAAACASRRNRSTNDGSRAYSGNSAFSAIGPVEQPVVAEVHLGHPALRQLALRSRSDSRRPDRPVTYQNHPIYSPQSISHGRAALRLRSASRIESTCARQQSPPSTCAASGAATRPPVPLSPERQFAAVLHQDCDRVPGRLGRREADEPRVRGLPLDLRGAGLARDLDARDLGARAGAVVHHVDHEVAHRRRGARFHRLAVLVRFVARAADHFAVGVLHVVEHVRHHHHAAVGDTLRDHRHLERRHCDRALADRRLREQRLVLLERPGLGSDAAHDVRAAGRCRGPACRRRTVRCPRRTCCRGRARSARTSCCTTRGTIARACRRMCCRRSSTASRSVCGRSSSFSSGYTGLSTVSRYGGPGGSGEFGFSSLSRPMPVVTTLNVEPGGKISRHARASAGLVGSAFSAVKYAPAAWVSWLASRFGSNVGLEYAATMPPVCHVEHDDGAAPPASASAAACCAFCSIVSTTLPRLSLPLKKSLMSSMAMSKSRPTSWSLYFASTPVLPRLTDLVADDVCEQLRRLGRVDADLLEVAFGRHRLGEDRPVRR